MPWNSTAQHSLAFVISSSYDRSELLLFHVRRPKLAGCPLPLNNNVCRHMYNCSYVPSTSCCPAKSKHMYESTQVCPHTSIYQKGTMLAVSPFMPINAHPLFYPITTQFWLTAGPTSGCCSDQRLSAPSPKPQLNTSPNHTSHTTLPASPPGPSQG